MLSKQYTLFTAIVAVGILAGVHRISAQSGLSVEQTTISQGALHDAEIRVEEAQLAGGPPPAAPDGSEAPVLLNSFDAVDFDTGAATSLSYHIPPDPSGAAGPNHIVVTVNTTIEWYTKTGVRQNRQSLMSFFASLSPLTRTFDPKVIFDPHNNRFVVVTLERTDTTAGGAANTSRIFVAVSAGSDPNGSWYFHAIDSMITITAQARWADFPGIATDKDAVYITANMFAFGASPGSSVGVRLWIINKTPFFSGGPASVVVYDPIALASGAINTTAQPAQIYGTAPSNVGTFLVQYGGIANMTMTFVGIIRIDNPLNSPTFTNSLLAWGAVRRTTMSRLHFRVRHKWAAPG